MGNSNDEAMIVQAVQTCCWRSNFDDIINALFFPRFILYILFPFFQLMEFSACGVGHSGFFEVGPLYINFEE